MEGSNSMIRYYQMRALHMYKPPMESKVFDFSEPITLTSPADRSSASKPEHAVSSNVQEPAIVEGNTMIRYYQLGTYKTYNSPLQQEAFETQTAMTLTETEGFDPLNPEDLQPAIKKTPPSSQALPASATKQKAEVDAEKKSNEVKLRQSDEGKGQGHGDVPVAASQQPQEESEEEPHEEPEAAGKDLVALARERDACAAELAVSKAAHQASQQELENVRTALASKEASYEATTKELAAAQSALDHQEAEFQKEKDSYQQQLEALKASIHGSTKELESAKIALQKKEAKESLEKELAALKAAQETTQKDLAAALKREKDAATKEAAAVKAAKDAAQKDIAAAAEKEKESQRKEAALKAEVEALKRDLAAKAADCTDPSGTSDSKALEAAQKELLAATSALAQSNSDHEKALAKVKEAHAQQIAALEADVAAAKNASERNVETPKAVESPKASEKTQGKERPGSKGKGSKAAGGAATKAESKTDTVTSWVNQHLTVAVAALVPIVVVALTLMKR